jgi:hypothetical protein
MKDWQKGYELDYLLDLEERWELYNKHSLSPFSEMRKDKIAYCLDECTLLIDGGFVYNTYVVKTRSLINMFKGVPIGEKNIGDRVVEKLSFDPRNTEELTHSLDYDESTWLYIWQEDEDYVKLASDAGYTYVGSKFTSFAEIIGIWFKEKIHPFTAFFGPREHTCYLKEEDYTICSTKNDVNDECISSIREKLNDLGKFENHYSNYNKSDSWSAISLRGYLPDVNFIIDPIEMNKKWHEKHQDDDFELQDTELREKFPEVDELLNWVTTPIHRIRFMKLSPGGGTLDRHTDQTDPKTGVKNGKLMRFHWPIITNKDVIFDVWGKDGINNRIHMDNGSCWYLDIRKPHKAVNNGISDRIHLVVDIEASEEMRCKL